MIKLEQEGKLQNNRGRFANKHRDAWVEVNLGHLEANVLEIRKHIPKEVEILAVVKADSYGHGSVMCAPTLMACGVTSFGVASIDEALELRENKITAPILVIGAVPIWSFESALLNNITISIFNDEHLEIAKNLYEKTGQKLNVHIKIDTGMNRIGISHKKALEFIKKVQNSSYINLKGIFTHFADVEDEAIFNMQLSVFKEIVNKIDRTNLKVHCANSTAILTKDCYFDMVRAGIILYGLTPFNENKDFSGFKQIVSVRGRVVNVHTIEKNEGVSYGYKFIADKKTKVATIPIGYADGISRKLSQKIYGSVNGIKVKQIGAITMDQMMFDVSDIEDIKTGDIITILGQDGDNFFSVDEWANILGTINYELTCRLKVRLPRVYTRG